MPVAVFWFEVPFRGSVGLLMLMSLVYLMTTLGIGLFVSTSQTPQQQAMTTSSFFFLLPMVFLSGFIFPIENMPAAVQTVTYLVPVRYFLVILRGIFLKGIGLEVLWPQALALFAWGLASSRSPPFARASASPEAPRSTSWSGNGFAPPRQEGSRQ